MRRINKKYILKKFFIIFWWNIYFDLFNLAWYKIYLNLRWFVPFSLMSQSHMIQFKTLVIFTACKCDQSSKLYQMTYCIKLNIPTSYVQFSFLTLKAEYSLSAMPINSLCNILIFGYIISMTYHIHHILYWHFLRMIL